MSQIVSLDVRGLSCPQPALRVGGVIQGLSEGTIEVLVDCGTAQDNVTRLAERAGWVVTSGERPDGTVRLELRR